MQIFSDSYKDDVFYIWYNNNKPHNKFLYNMIPVEAGSGQKPTVLTLGVWVSTIFKPRAEAMDSRIRDEIENRLLQEKIAMLQRHSDLGVKMQDIAIKYIDDHKNELTSNSAVRLLVEGVRIERESRGMPEALQKMLDKSDEELLAEVEQMFVNAPVLEEPNE